MTELPPVFLTKLQAADAAVINDYMRDKEISDNTLVIPFPYTIENAQTWIEDTLILEDENNRQKNFAIRNAEGLILGVIGFHFNYGWQAGKSEFGYWLGKPHWNKGIMPRGIQIFCELAKGSYNMNLLEAYVFEFNTKSMHVLEKCGFTRTGDTITHTKWNGEQIKGIGYIRKV